ncbi:MAG: FlaD/FlaE family flagellar protein [Halobacteriota archaeon]
MNLDPDDYDPEELRRLTGQSPSADDGTASEGQSGTFQFGDTAGRPRDEAGGNPRPNRKRVPGRSRVNHETRQSDERRRKPRRNAADHVPQESGATERVDDPLRSSRLEQLFLQQSMVADGTLKKPYLVELPQQYAAERVIFDWLEFLVLTGGFRHAMEALRYYRTIDWITDDVESALQNYLHGFSVTVEDSTELDVDDHQLSLVYLAQLASMA